MKKNRKRKYGLDFYLWLAFFGFAVLILLFCEGSQLMILQQMKREQTLDNLSFIARETDKIQLRPDNANKYLDYLSESFGVQAKIISSDGCLRYPYQAEECEYGDIVLILTKREHDSGILKADSSEYAYYKKIFLGGEPCYLYVTDSPQLDVGLFRGILFQTLYVTAILLLVVTILSGMLSSYIARPISDLTEKAKLMSSGNLSVNFEPESRFVYRDILELSDSLNHAESELSKADQMQKELIANVSHDFKTPLTMIKAYAAMIQDISGDDPVKRQKHTQIIMDEADRLATLVNDMLDLSKLSAGIDSLKPSLFNLSECLKTVVGRFGYLTETAGYVFKTDITDDVFVEADKEKIGQVLYNLIGNAVNYTGEDKRVVIRLYEENGVAHFSVKDTGKGIAPEELDDIWERYYRTKETHKRPVKGTGLGLSIVKAILTKHEFNFGVRSEVDKGSTFYVDFPTEKVAKISQEESIL